MSNSSSNTAPEDGKWALPRRDFLMIGSAAVVGVAASNASAMLRVVGAPASGAVLAIGFADAGAANEQSSVVAAKTLRARDGRIGETVRVTVHGISRPDETDAVSVRLSTFAPIANGVVPFLAWDHSVAPRGPVQTGARTSFLAALDDEGTLPIAIERYEPASRVSRLLSVAPPAPATIPDLAALEEKGNVCRLSSGDRGDVRLRAGTYFIALRRTASERQPDWSSIVVDRTAADLSTSLRRNGEPVGFEYIAVTIDAPSA